MVFSLSTGQRMLVIGLCRASHRNCHRSHCWQAVQVLCPNFVPHVGHNRFQRLAEIVRLQPNHYSQVCSDQHSARFHDCTTLHVLCPKIRIKRTQQNKNSIIIDAHWNPLNILSLEQIRFAFVCVGKIPIRAMAICIHSVKSI